MALVIHIFYGRESFSLREALTALQEKLAGGSPFPVQVDRLAGEKATPAEVINACLTAPFLGSHRLVIVEGLLGRFNPSGRAGGPGGLGTQGKATGRRRGAPADLGPWQALADAVETMPPSTVLVLVDEEVPPQNPLLVALSPKARLRTFPPLAQAAVPAWIQERARRLGVAITPSAADLLADMVGNNLWALASEMEKLSVYAAGRPIVEEDIRALVAASREAEVFPLVDAVVAGDRGRALRLLQQLMATDYDGPHLLALLARQYRMLLLAQEVGDRRLSREELARTLGIASPFVAEKVRAQAARYPRRRLEEAHRRLLAADVAMKRGIQSEEAALELLVGELTQQNTGAR